MAPTPPDLVITGTLGRVLLTIHRDGTVTGEIEDAGEAAHLFVDAVRGYLRTVPLTPEADTIIAILDRLRELYVPEGCGIWLYAPNERFGGKSAVQMIRNGEAKAVLAVISQLADGAL